MKSWNKNVLSCFLKQEHINKINIHVYHMKYIPRAISSYE